MVQARIGVIFFLLISSCLPQKAANSNSSEQGSFDEPITLHYQELVDLPDDLGTVQFTQLVKDHRCPIDAMCITQGTATVAFQYTNAAGSIENIELSMGDNEVLVHIFSEFIIDLEQIEPLPKASEEPNPNDYRVTVRFLER